MNLRRLSVLNYLALAAEIACLGLTLVLGYACLRSLFTTEIGFGRSTRIINLYKEPGWFWFAFWFQLLLAVGGTAACWWEIRKRVALIRAQCSSSNGGADA